MESRPASPRSGRSESTTGTTSASASATASADPTKEYTTANSPAAPILRLSNSLSTSSSDNEGEASRGYDDGGLVEALDREVARMAAANHLARARDELVKHMQATGMLKAVPPAQTEQVEIGKGSPQAEALQQQGLGEAWPGGHGSGRGDEEFEEMETQEMENESSNAGHHGEEHEAHGLGIVVDEGGQATVAQEEEQKEQDEQYDKQAWEREGKWCDAKLSGGSLGSTHGVGLVAEGEMTGFVEGNEITGLAGRREGRRKEREAAEQMELVMAFEAEMERDAENEEAEENGGSGQGKKMDMDTGATNVNTSRKA
ncbi:MAG: hypothetical protein Q9208_003052 [Pyrenodesmia sp. 3 TL-2023]